MKILFLTKRISTGKDILLARCGRLYELSSLLVSHGHDVTGICLSYRHGLEVPVTDDLPVKWQCYDVGRWRLPGLARYLSGLPAILEHVRPDIIIGTSDSLHVIAAGWLARRYDLPCLVDLYDNYESFGLTRLPLVRRLFREAVGRADAIAVVSPELSGFVRSTCKPGTDPVVIENAIPENLFAPMDAQYARKALNLPEDGVLIGTAGALDTSRGIGTLYEAFLSVAGQRNDMHLVLAGRTDRRVSVPEHDRIHYLGELDYGRIPYLFNALDIGVICNRAGAFGDYCFPQKLYEMLSCRLPVLAADVGAMHRLFRDFPHNLYTAGDAGSLARALVSLMQNPVLPDLAVPRWRDQGDRLNELVGQVCMRRG